MRGKGKRSITGAELLRITPAYAGKSKMPSPSCATEVGSPPPMRGKVPILGAMLVIGRITPAYAGKSHPATDTQKIAKDHPRLCGEKRGVSDVTNDI